MNYSSLHSSSIPNPYLFIQIIFKLYYLLIKNGVSFSSKLTVVCDVRYKEHQGREPSLPTVAVALQCTVVVLP